LQTPRANTLSGVVGSIATTVDAAAGGRVLVFGSLPPQGRDLDVLAHTAQREAVVAALAGDGLLTKNGSRWVGFADCTAAGVDLVDAAEWHLPEHELRSLFEEARVLAGFTHLAAPAAHHALLIAARRVARAGRYGAAVRTRVEAMSREHPSAWQEAATRAPAWRAERELAALSALHARDASPGVPYRLRALGVRLRRAPAPRRRAAGRILRRMARRPVIVSLSGLDGAGKSFQAERLANALSQLDYRAEIIWPPAANVMFQANPALKRRLFGVLRVLGRSDESTPQRADTDADATEYGDAAAQEPLPPQPAPVAHALALVVALVQAWSFRRGARAVRGHADVIIFDRYALDSIVYLRQRWGHGRRAFSLQSALIRLLTRRPQCAFLLDVAPEVAYARKRDFPLENLRERAALYSALHGRLGCVRLDGERAPEELCREIAATVWSCLA
jgi:thymidylate kinase